jgi:predicted DsbA family dithiol-disulfide isomerase
LPIWAAPECIRHGPTGAEDLHATATPGINAVPAVILNERCLIQGGQPAEVFEELLRRIAAEAGRAS